MNNSQNNIKPFIIGISGGSSSGKTSVVREVSRLLTDFEICTINLNSYYKDLTEEEYSKLSDYNFDQPHAFDFDLIQKHIIALRNGESIDMPRYDFVTSKRLSTTQLVKSSPVIIFEGILAFFNKQIRNFMDLKIFIDTDCDVRLSRRSKSQNNIITIVYRDIEERGRDLKHVIKRYHKFIKPAYDNYIGPTKKYADIIIPRGATNEAAIQIVSEYLKMKLNKTIFYSIKEVIDPKIQFYDKKVLVTEEKFQIEFLKIIFEDAIKNEEEPEFLSSIREKMLSILPDTLIQYFRNKKNFSSDEALPRIDLVITENDSIDNIDIKEIKTILFFKTCILAEEDMKIPEYILSQNKSCVLIINTIFLSPKFADQLLFRNQINHLIFNTLYFSDFFIKFEQMIKESKATFDKTKLCKTFKDVLAKAFT